MKFSVVNEPADVLSQNLHLGYSALFEEWKQICASQVIRISVVMDIVIKSGQATS